jgi:hypothetical protein
LSKIIARDHFDAPGRAAAEAVVTGRAQALAEFEAAALSAETGADAGPAIEPAARQVNLRVVKDTQPTGPGGGKPLIGVAVALVLTWVALVVALLVAKPKGPACRGGAAAAGPTAAAAPLGHRPGYAAWRPGSAGGAAGLSGDSVRRSP